MVFTWAVKLACHVLGHMYAGYASYKALKSGDAALHKQWLSYWIVNTLFVVFEVVADSLVSWLPLYYEAKLAFVVWLIFYNGASLLYDRVVHRYIMFYETDIDQHLSALQEGASRVVGDVAKTAGTHIRNQSATVVTNLITMATAGGSSTPAAAGSAAPPHDPTLAAVSGVLSAAAAATAAAASSAARSGRPPA